jgi:hypothetical protein
MVFACSWFTYHWKPSSVPHPTFARWAEVYGPIYYSVRTGSASMIMLSSTDVAKEIKFEAVPFHHFKLPVEMFVICHKSILALSLSPIN